MERLQNMQDKKEDIRNLKRIVEERKRMKDDITTCEWCGITYPKGGQTYYKIRVRNMNLEKLVKRIEEGTEFINDEFDEHIICSDCCGHLEECKEC